MLISVIVPVYNAENYLKECLDSIIKQTYQNLEIILVDDGSLDKSGEICDEYAVVDNRIKVIHRENAGVSVARNTGIDRATGEFIAFVDSDDYLTETMFQKLYEKIGDNDISICRFAYEYRDKTVYYQEDNLFPFTEKPYYFEYIMADKYNKSYPDRIICDKIFGSVCRTLFKRKIIVNNNIRFTKGMKIAEDRLFLIEYCSYCNKAGLVDEYLYHYRADVENSATSVFKKYQENLHIAQKISTQRQLELIEKNDKLTRIEKKRLNIYLKNKMCYTVALNEILYNDKDYEQKLKKIFADSFFSKAIKFNQLWCMYSIYNTPFKTIVLYIMIKLKLWKILRGRLGTK